MSTREGNSGRGAREYGDSLNPSVLAGVLASDVEEKFYPDNYCHECTRLGRDLDKCFHWHWNQDGKEAK